MAKSEVKRTAKKTVKGLPLKKASVKKKSPIKKDTAALPQKASAKKSSLRSAPEAGDINKINVRMYRAGTGDFFLLQFKSGGRVRFNMMIDCGCIKGGKASFAPLIDDLKTQTRSIIDLLVVTHEHADHINGFQSAADLFDTIQFKKVWFAWTEDRTDKTANEYRKKYTKTKFALNVATQQLTGLVQNKYYENLFKNQFGFSSMLGAQKHFIDSVSELNALNGTPVATAGTKTPTMADLLKDWNVIKKNTEVEFLSPGDLRNDLEKAPGIRFYVLGPPRDLDSLSAEEKQGESYQKRENPSSVDFAFVNALTSGSDVKEQTAAFDKDYEIATANSAMQLAYQSQPWRNIDNDWLLGAGGLALRFQRSINNTSLALAIQFETSERVLLFPGDAEYGNWKSWYNGLLWTIQKGKVSKKVDATYLLENTVFYKVGHHLSQNGTAKALGIEKMTHEDLTAMATLDFKKINSGWLNTMPNDLLGADLIARTKGKLYFLGDCSKIMKNIKTDRVTVKSANESQVDKLNRVFDGEFYIDYEVQG